MNDELLDLKQRAYVAGLLESVIAQGFSPDQLYAVQVALFAPPELPEHLNRQDALLAWQARLSDVVQRMTARGYGAHAEAILSRFEWQRGCSPCRLAYEELRDACHRLAAGLPTAFEVEKITRAFTVAGAVTVLDSAAMCAYLLDLEKPAYAQALSRQHTEALMTLLSLRSADELAACLLEARRAFGVFAP